MAHPRAQGFFFHSQISLFRQFLRELGGAPEAPERALEIYLAGTVLWSRFARRGIKHSRGRDFIDQLRRSSSRYWRDLAGLIEKGSDETFQRFFQVSGLEHLETALRAKKGVIITTYHNTANRIAMAALPRRLQCEPIPTISIMRAFYLEKQRGRENAEYATEETLITDLTLEGKSLLENGKIIQIVPDNTSDTVGDRPLTIAGRRFHVKPGLAEYALLTGAAIVPQYSTRRLDGSIHMAFQPAFEIPPADAHREDRIFSILKQYAAFVNRSWSLAPEAINFSALSKLMRKPLSSEAAIGGGNPLPGPDPRDDNSETTPETDR